MVRFVKGSAPEQLSECKDTRDAAAETESKPMLKSLRIKSKVRRAHETLRDESTKLIGTRLATKQAIKSIMES